MDLDFPNQEKKILDLWKKKEIFKKSIIQRKKAPDFVFYEGPPTANAKPGIHHVLSRVWKDVICRYKTMRGFRVLRKAGWDTHGLPVELEIEKKLGFKMKKDIERYGIAKFNKKCRESVWAYKKDWERLTERIGFWLDMEHPYITYENEYIETLWWIIKTIWEKGLLYQDYKVVPHCPRCGTSLSSHEVALGYKTIKEPAIYVKLKIKSEKLKTKIKNLKLNSYLLIWTTTPWTLPGNAAVAVNPRLTYVVVKKGGEVLVLAKERLRVLGEGYETITEMKGNDLLGIEYEPLYAPPGFKLQVSPYQNKFGAGQACFKIIAGGFVSAEEGTGLVHIAPAFGEEDMIAGKRNNLPVLRNVDESGRFTSEVKNWAGMFVKKADPLVIEDLRKRGLLFRQESYEHDYPFCWRCDSPLLYYAKKSWFIRMSALKKDLQDANRTINWIPSYLKGGRFGEWLKEAKDWAFSRERYWGTPLPLWECRKCGFREVVGSKAELLSKKFTSNRYFVMRHGHSLRQVTNRISSWPEKFHCPLTREGIRQIRVQAKKLKKEEIDLIYSSDLLRARQTAEIIAKELRVPLKFDKRLRELDSGIFNGEHMGVFREWGLWNDPDKRFTVRPPKGEHYAGVKKRMYRFLLDIDRKYKEKTILLISHELPLSVLEGAVRGFSNKEILAYRERNRIGVGEYRPLKLTVLPYDERGNVDFHRPYIDRVRFLCPQCGEYMERAQELIDVWFDSGAMPFAQAHFPFACAKTQNSKLKTQNYRKLIKKILFPADYICEAVDQTRGWFYTLLAVSTLLGLGAPYKNVTSLGHVLDEKGEKMSKSKGNVVDPWQLIEKYGADAIRWYFFTVNQPGDSKLFSEKGIQLALQKFIFTLWNSYMFWKTYTRKSKVKSQKPKARGTHILDKWIISKFNNLITDVTRKLDAYDVTGATRAIEEFVVDDLSQWYIRRSRRRLQRPKTEKEFQEASGTLAFVLLELSKLCAPFIPFFAEELYLQLGGRGSVHLEDWPKARQDRRDSALEKQMRQVREIVALGLAQRAKAGIKVRQPLASLEIKNQKAKIKNELVELIKDEVNVKRIVFGKRFFLDTAITPELREEGVLREIIRYIQDLRKQAGLKPHQFISLFYDAPKDVRYIFSKYKNMIITETKARNVIEKKGSGMKEIYVDGKRVLLGIKK